MKRFHVHVAVKDLSQSIRFYSALFDVAPTVARDDYAKWQLDDPRVNFAISTRAQKSGIDHLGIQADSGEELEGLARRLAIAQVSATPQTGVTCCYAKSDKYWTVDPQGIAWESFHTLEPASTYQEEPGSEETPRSAAGACCT